MIQLTSTNQPNADKKQGDFENYYKILSKEI